MTPVGTAVAMFRTVLLTGRSVATLSLEADPTQLRGRQQLNHRPWLQQVWRSAADRQ